MRPGAGAAAVLFDLDGLLVDSEPVWFEVESAAVGRLGGGWTHADQAACVGGTIDRTVRYILRLTGADVPADRLRDEVVAQMALRFRESLPVYPGGTELVDAVRAAGVPVGLVSSSYRVLVDAALHRLGPQRFAVSVSGDEVVHGKPDPEPYATACARLGVPASRCVVLEDAPAGIASAEAAGCVVVAVPCLTPVRPTPRRPVLGSLAEVDPDWLLSLPDRLAPAPH